MESKYIQPLKDSLANLNKFLTDTKKDGNVKIVDLMGDYRDKKAALMDRLFKFIIEAGNGFLLTPFNIELAINHISMLSTDFENFFSRKKCQWFLK